MSEGLQKGIAEAGFVRCTPIQSKALPLALAGRDVAGQAQTGTGKTAAFLVAMFHRLEHNPPLTTDKGPPAPRALIMTPTRELAVQVHSDASVLGKYLPFTLGLAFGGTDYDKQRAQLAAGVDILIGTPGRLIDFYKQRVFGLRGVQVLVLDEADRMFDLGFIKDIRYVLRRLPEHHRRLNLLFSATLSYRVLELAYEHMNDPELVRIEPDKMTVDSVRQTIYFPSMEEKLPLLLALLRDRDPSRTMIFVNTRREADRLRDALQANGIKAEALSGDVPQKKRLRMLRDFQAGELSVLIGTDVASRGLHVPGVSHVFNYDLPQDPEDYVHRIGRTARAGASGDAISFGCETYAISLPDIEAFIGRKIPVATFDRDALVEVKPAEPRRHRPRHGGGRQGHGDGHGRRHGGGGHARGGGRAHAGGDASAGGHSHAGEQPHAAADVGGAGETGRGGDAAGGAGSGGARKRRRRRRRRGSHRPGNGDGGGDASGG